MTCMDKEEDKEKLAERCQTVGDIWISSDNGWNSRHINSVKKEPRPNSTESEKLHLLFSYSEHTAHSVVDKISNNSYTEQFALKPPTRTLTRSEAFSD